MKEQPKTSTLIDLDLGMAYVPNQEKRSICFVYLSIMSFTNCPNGRTNWASSVNKRSKSTELIIAQTKNEKRKPKKRRTIKPKINNFK